MRFNKFVSVSVASLLACTIVPFSECVRTDLVVYAEDTADTLSMGDVNADGLVDAVDATLVLTEYARLSTGSDYSFTDSQIAVADINSDGLVDAVDASLILAYYAYLSTGGTMSFESYNIYINSSSKDVYTAYLSQQNLCQVSNDCKILEPGTVTGNPNGLAGVVKHDFDGDGIDELVTFTFDKNSTDGEDIRVDLLKVNGDELVVADSRYITELADISSQPKDDTIYFDYGATTEIVTSEYNGNLYFGCLFSEVVNEFSRGGDSFGGFGIFTIENDKITEQSVGYDMAYVTSDEVCVSLLPPNIRNTEISDDLINEDNNIIAFMFSEFSPVTQGLYKSAEEARSAMTNEFGLDIEAKDDYYTYNIPDYHWVSADGSDVKTILNTEYILSFESMSSSFLSVETCYDGIKWILNSDLELLLNIDRNSFKDELALYEDILRYPSYYHEVWDKYTSRSNEKVRYFIADIDSDNQYELVISSYTTSTDINYQLTIVKASLEGFDMFEGDNGVISFYDNGVVLIDYMSNGGYDSKSYCDIANNIYWTAWNTKETSGGNTTYIRHISIKDSDYELIGDEAVAKENELLSGAKLMPEFNSYDLYSPEDFKELVFVDDVSKIRYNWQKAYINQIEEKSTKEKMEYSLIYIDDDNIPELIIGDPIDSRIGGVYTYYNGSSTELTYLTLRCNMDGYIEKSGTFGVYWWWLEKEGYYIYEIENGALNTTDTFLITHTADGAVYTINDEEVTESVYNDTYASCSADFTGITYYTYDKIIAKLSSDTN